MGERDQEIVDAVATFPDLKIREIAGRRLISAGSVYAALKRAGVKPDRGRLYPHRMAERDAALVAAAQRVPVPTLRELGAEFGITREYARLVLKASGTKKSSLRGRKGVARGHSPCVLERMAAKDAKREQKRAALEDRIRAVRHMRGAGAKWAEIGRALWPHCASPAVRAIQFSAYHGLTDVMARARKQG